MERVAPLKQIQDRKNELLLHELFVSIQGESTHSGRVCVFVRLTACHLRCTYCDTEHAFYKGSLVSIPELIEKIKQFGVPLVEITGGEPLLQPGVLPLMTALCDAGFEVLLETSGAVSIAKVDRRVKVILDVKTPGSGEDKRNVWSNLKILWSGCEVKFVVCDLADYEFAKRVVFDYELTTRTPVLFSPVEPTMDKVQLAEWIVADKLAVRMQIQLHKVLWGNRTGV